MTQSRPGGPEGNGRTRSGKAGFIREYNRWLVANLLRREGPLSRADLASRLGLSAPAVSRIVEGLIRQGYVEETGLAHTAVGRRPRMLGIRAEAGSVVAVDLRRVDRVEVGLVDLQGCLVGSRERRLESLEPAAVVAEIGRLAREVVSEWGGSRPRPMAVGLACPGVIDFERGTVEYSAHLLWRDVPIRSMLSEELGLPTVVDTDCNAPALAESWLGAGATVDHLVYLALGPGLGVGIVVGGSVYRGASGAAGELGHTVVQVEGGRRCRCGNWGCAETFLSDEAIVQSARDAGVDVGAPSEGDGPAAVARVFAAARDGDEAARLVVERVSRALEVLVLNILNLLNPQLLVVDAQRGAEEELLAVARRAAEHCALPLVGRAARIETPTLGDKTVLVGAAMLVLERFWQAPVFDIEVNYRGLAGTRSIGREPGAV
ncbi:MAG: ROK family transcriptional regulator [Anaerolineae bacterium]|nr:ROK family transcriptional regulator [Anaerolineae bacterium]